MRRFRIVALALAVFASILGTANVSGATIQACTGTGGFSGWFDTYNDQGVRGAINCSIDGNHIVLDVWKGAVQTQGAMECWYPSTVTPVFGPSGYGPFQIKFMNISGAYAPGWWARAWSTQSSTHKIQGFDGNQADGMTTENFAAITASGPGYVDAFQAGGWCRWYKRGYNWGYPTGVHFGADMTTNNLPSIFNVATVDVWMN